MVLSASHRKKKSWLADARKSQTPKSWLSWRFPATRASSCTSCLHPCSSPPAKPSLEVSEQVSPLQSSSPRSPTAPHLPTPPPLSSGTFTASRPPHGQRQHVPLNMQCSYTPSPLTPKSGPQPLSHLSLTISFLRTGSILILSDTWSTAQVSIKSANLSLLMLLKSVATDCVIIFLDLYLLI